MDVNSRQWIFTALDAVNLLIHSYKYRIGLNDCPLCEVFECSACPWGYYLDKHCYDQDQNIPQIRRSPRRHSYREVNDQVIRLVRWRKKLLKRLNY
jgi:hypothetical protein